jgi:hypothetical protein
MPWWVELVVAALLSGVGAVYMTYAANARVDVQRLTVVETKQDASDKRLDRMEGKLDHLIEGMMGEKPEPRK